MMMVAFLLPHPSHPIRLCSCCAQGLEAILRVRCSSGLDVEGYVGSFYKPPNSPTDLYLPAIDCDKALVARLEIMEKLPANSEVREERGPEARRLAVARARQGGAGHHQRRCVAAAGDGCSRVSV